MVTLTLTEDDFSDLCYCTTWRIVTLQQQAIEMSLPSPYPQDYEDQFQRLRSRTWEDIRHAQQLMDRVTSEQLRGAAGREVRVERVHLTVTKHHVTVGSQDTTVAMQLTHGQVIEAARQISAGRIDEGW